LLGFPDLDLKIERRIGARHAFGNPIQ